MCVGVRVMRESVNERDQKWHETVKLNEARREGTRGEDGRKSEDGDAGSEDRTGRCERRAPMSRI